VGKTWSRCDVAAPTALPAPDADVLDLVGQVDPQFLRRFLDFAAVPWRYGTLPASLRELIYVAIDASVTHMYQPGVAMHTAGALAAGATPEAVVNAVEIASLVGIEALLCGIPAVPGMSPSYETARDDDLEARYISVRGCWDDRFAPLLAHARPYFAAYLDLFDWVWRADGPLTPLERELVALAVDASVAHLHEAGVATHARQAIALGARPEQVVEVLGLVCALGLHAATAAFPTVMERTAADPTCHTDVAQNCRVRRAGEPPQTCDASTNTRHTTTIGDPT
jgi:AhpD family alkylhydroperoxidase